MAVTGESGRSRALRQDADKTSTAGRLVAAGLAAGVVAGMAMAMWVMFAGGTFREFGVFTALYLIAAPFAGVQEVRESLSAADAGNLFWWSTGAALLGAVIHMAWSMMFRVLFGGVARALRLPSSSVILIGMVYGVAVMFVMLSPRRWGGRHGPSAT